MANSRSAMADLGGKHVPEHKLVFDASTGVRSSDQRSPSVETANGSTNHTGGRGSGHSAGEEGTNEDDDEDSSAGQEDELDDEEDDPEVLAPSRGKGLGKGKRPAIRIDPIDNDESQDDDESSALETGHTLGKQPVNSLMPNKKRTFSNVSNSSLLFGEEDTETKGFPRRKIARKLSSNDARPLLTYKEDQDHDMNDHENAVASSDEDDDIDDEDYSGVNLISDESDIEEQEEEYLVTQALHKEFDMNPPRRLSLGSAASDDFFSFDNMMGPGLATASALPDIGFGQFFEPEARPATPEANINRKFSVSSSKRVRFEDEVQVSDSSSSSASELDSSVWPDLFLEQDKLPASLYQLMETDNDVDDLDDVPSSGSEHSYWDFGQDESRSHALPLDEDFDESSDPGSSGYETDMGDTTDEYDSDFASDAPPQTPKQKSVLRRPSSALGSRATSPRPFQRSRPATNGRTPIMPVRGIFIHEESSKAIAVTNRATKTLTFYRPRAPLSIRQPNYATFSSTTSTANNSPRASVQQFSDSEMSQEAFINPFQNSDIMLTGIFGTAPANNYLFGDAIGPPEAFFPFIDVQANGNIYVDEEGEFDDEYDEDDEEDVNIRDFMDFGDDATDEDDGDTDVPATPATSMIALPGSTPAQATPMVESPTSRKRTVSDAMLEHFDRGVVTAFRNNQDRARDLTSLPHDPDLRASVSRPVRSGKSAETLMSPLRKRSSMTNRNRRPTGGVAQATSRLQSSVMGARRGPAMGTFS